MQTVINSIASPKTKEAASQQNTTVDIKVRHSGSLEFQQADFKSKKSKESSKASKSNVREPTSGAILTLPPPQEVEVQH